MRNKLRIVVGIFIMAIGICIYLYPAYQDKKLSREANTVMEQIMEYRESARDETEEKEEVCPQTEEVKDGTKTVDNEEANAYVDLYEEMQEYNARIMENGQQLVDAWSYAQPPSGIITPLAGDAVGCIRIPDMNVELPLYIGATNEHMAAGAAVLSETSMPIGGRDTNCVIAGHRGYSGSPYFRDIELLKEGSKVIIENLWETLTYEVTEITIVDPGDMESILIQPGRDMVTLLTCHPYMGGGRYRYIVYCERAGNLRGEETEKVTEGLTEKGQDQSEKENLPAVNVSSESVNLIQLERALRIVLPVLLVILAFLLIIKKPKK